MKDTAIGRQGGQEGEGYSNRRRGRVGRAGG